MTAPSLQVGKPGRLSRLASVGVLACFVPSLSTAATIALLPPTGPVFLESGTLQLELVMDFDGEPTVGGGLDFLVSGPVAIQAFTPSAWFSTVPDPAFTGFGTELADADFEIHFGSFDGFSGQESLGLLTFALLDVGEAGVSLAINTRFEGFTSITAAELPVLLNGTSWTVTRVPAPPAAWLLVTGLAALGCRARTRSPPRVFTTTSQ